MNISTILGVVGCLALIAMGIITGGNTLLTFWDLPSFLIVFGGSYLGLFTYSTMSDTLGIFGTVGLTFKAVTFNEAGIIQKLMAMSEKARREGILALEEDMADLDNEFMKKGLRLAVDGTDGEIIQDLMEIEISKMQARHAKKIAVLFQWATVAPAVGMLGTVIGLVAMMKNLSDKDSVGPNMALALITTLYGAIVAHFFCTPMAVKLRTQDAEEAASMEMIIEGVLSIQAGDNPRIVAMKLLAYLPPQDRTQLEKELIKD
jgi:chemotaxis protein MotA